MQILSGYQEEILVQFLELGTVLLWEGTKGHEDLW